MDRSTIKVVMKHYEFHYKSNYINIVPGSMVPQLSAPSYVATLLKIYECIYIYKIKYSCLQDSLQVHKNNHNT